LLALISNLDISSPGSSLRYIYIRIDMMHQKYDSQKSTSLETLRTLRKETHQKHVHIIIPENEAHIKHATLSLQ
jgi:hypothetical protein